MNLVTSWFQRHFNDPQVVILAMLLLIGFGTIFFFGNVLMPALASLVIAYLLEGLVIKLEKLKMPRIMAVLLIFAMFIAVMLFVMFALLPMLTRQIAEALGLIPQIVAWVQAELKNLQDRYEFLSQEQVVPITEAIRTELVAYGQKFLAWSVASARNIVTILVYLVLMPLMVFFFLKDKVKIVAWIKKFLPDDRTLAEQVWADVDLQISNYIRGKVWEILLVWVATLWTFTLLGLDLAMLLSFFTGLSVLVPYVGATVMTIPVAIIGYFQFGPSSEFAYVMIAYGVIQLIDGNILAPLLLSEVTNMHPVAVILSVLVFGGLWGFWGVFFAIPLATLVHAILKAWPTKARQRTAESESDPGSSAQTA